MTTEENGTRVSPEELAALLDHRRVDDANGYRFHRVQDGYSDGIPRAVFVEPDEDPIGVAILNGGVTLLMLLIGRLSADLRDARAKGVRAERCAAWLEAHAVDIEAKVDDDCDGPDADDLCAQAAVIREAAREMAKAFGVAVPR